MISQEILQNKIRDCKELHKVNKVKVEESYSRLSTIVPSWYNSNHQFAVVLSCDKNVFSSYPSGDTAGLENKYKLWAKDGKSPDRVNMEESSNGWASAPTFFSLDESNANSFFVFTKSGLEQGSVPKNPNPKLEFGNVGCSLLIGYVNGRGNGKFTPIVTAEEGARLYHITAWQNWDTLYTSDDSAERFRQEIAPAIVDLDTSLRIMYDNQVDIAWLESLSQRLSTSQITTETNWQPCKYFQTLYGSPDWDAVVSQNTSDSLNVYLASVERESQGSGLFSPVDVAQEVISQENASENTAYTEISSDTQNIFRKYLVVWLFLAVVILYYVLKRFKK